MANIKSAKKRILVIETKTLRNKSIKSKVKTCIKNVEVAVAKGDKEAAQAALTVAISEISKAKLLLKEFSIRTQQQEKFPVLQKRLTELLN